MNKVQFRTVRSQLGLNERQMGKALGFRYTTIQLLETGVDTMREEDFTNRRARLDHIVSYACAWMLLCGGPMIPWTEEEDAPRFRAFREHHQLNNEEMAALFGVSIRTAEYFLSPQGRRFVAPRHLMALCWMRIMGSKDPFATLAHNQFSQESRTASPIQIKPMFTEKTDSFRLIIDA